MKRRNKSWLIAALVALSAVMVLTGCSLSQVLSLTIVDYPATTYVRSNTTPDIEFTVAAEMDDGETRELTYSRYSSVLKLSGFSTTEVGTFTATVTYRNVSATFDYEVVAESSDFAGGVGTESNPYIINNAEQFAEIQNYAGSHFKLGADIDFSEMPFEGARLFDTMNGGSLDGNGYKLYNFVTSRDTTHTIFYHISNATIKNLDVYANIYAPMALYATDTVFENVDCYGEVVLTVDERNYGNYFNYAQGDCVLKDCTNYREIKGASLYAAAFVGYLTLCDSVTLENCVNKADITAIGASVLVGNLNQSWKADEVNGVFTPRYESKLIIKNCKNEGTVRGVRNSNFIFADGAYKDSYIASESNQSVKDDGMIAIKMEKTFYLVDSTENQIKETEQKITREIVFIDQTSYTQLADVNEMIKDPVSADSYITATLDTNNNNEINVTVTEKGKAEVSYFVVLGYYYTTWLDNGINAGTQLRTTYKQISASEMELGKAYASGVYHTSVIGVEGTGTDTTDCWALGSDGKYWETQTDTAGLGVGNTANLTFYVFAYDAEGNVIAGTQVTK